PIWPTGTATFRLGRKLLSVQMPKRKLRSMGGVVVRRVSRHLLPKPWFSRATGSLPTTAAVTVDIGRNLIGIHTRFGLVPWGRVAGIFVNRALRRSFSFLYAPPKVSKCLRFLRDLVPTF